MRAGWRAKFYKMAKQKHKTDLQCRELALENRELRERLNKVRDYVEHGRGSDYFVLRQLVGLTDDDGWTLIEGRKNGCSQANTEI
jgi:hypothetical protein